MTVTSKELHDDPRPAEKATTAPLFATGNAWPVGVALVVLGVPMWLAGGKYTVEGWVDAINLFASWLSIPIVISRPVGYWLLGILVPVAILYSRVEVRHRPIQWKNGRLHFKSDLLFWAAWLFIIGTDLVTTYLGVQTPAADAWRITQQVAASPWLSGAWATILTFLPEWAIIGGLYLIKR